MSINKLIFNWQRFTEIFRPYYNLASDGLLKVIVLFAALTIEQRR